MNVKTKPFTTPNFIIEDDDFAPHARGFRLDLFSGEELSAKCDEFRAEVFKKAGKKDPRSTP